MVDKIMNADAMIGLRQAAEIQKALGESGLGAAREAMRAGLEHAGINVSEESVELLLDGNQSEASWLEDAGAPIIVPD